MNHFLKTLLWSSPLTDSLQSIHHRCVKFFLLQNCYYIFFSFSLFLAVSLFAVCCFRTYYDRWQHLRRAEKEMNVSLLWLRSDVAAPIRSLPFLPRVEGTYVWMDGCLTARLNTRGVLSTKLFLKARQAIISFLLRTGNWWTGGEQNLLTAFGMQMRH